MPIGKVKMFEKWNKEKHQLREIERIIIVTKSKKKWDGNAPARRYLWISIGLVMRKCPKISAAKK